MKKLLGTKPVLESAQRSFNVFWQCCGQNDFVFANADPELSNRLEFGR
jgi:hypothetical protein